MTFNPAEYHLLEKEYPMFSLWALLRDVLFQPKVDEDNEFSGYDLTSKAYIFMKRLGQDYNRVMLMDSDERDKIFEMEMKLIKEEAKDGKDKTN